MSQPPRPDASASPAVRRRLLALGLPFAASQWLAACATPAGTPSPAPVSSRAGTPVAPPPPGVPRPPMAGGVPAPAPGVSLPPAPATPAAPGVPATASPLASEERWLRDLFNGTPVVIQTDADGALRVSVPAEFSFDTGQGVVKPPLGAVLDRLSASMRRQPRSRLSVYATSDPGLPAALANDRVGSVREYLLTRGIPYTRTVAAGRARTEGVEMLLAP